MAASTDWHSRTRAPTAVLAALLWTCLAAANDAPGAAVDAAAGRQPATGQQIRPYSARYAIYRNGRLSGKLDVSLRRQGEQWTLTSEGAGTHGLARILAARDNEEVAGHLQGGRFLPDRYTRHTRMATLDDYWFFDFDWATRRVSVVHDRSDPLLLDMVGDSLDPLSLKLEMRQRLQQPDPQLQFHMVGEDEIDGQDFRVLPREWMETSLGCLATTPVERIRHNSTRYTRAWHAPDLDNIEVRMEHGKTGGNYFEMRITELSLDGDAVRPRPGCAALQGAEEPSTGNP
jgi:hypothetical protein